MTNRLRAIGRWLRQNWLACLVAVLIVIPYLIDTLMQFIGDLRASRLDRKIESERSRATELRERAEQQRARSSELARQADVHARSAESHRRMAAEAERDAQGLSAEEITHRLNRRRR